jgi:tRNA(adenine34) deaminase
MLKAIELAKQAEQAGEVPVGAILVQNNKVIGQGYNQPIQSHDPSAHAEIQALRDAGQQAGNYRFPGATLYVTLEPCTMCAGSIIHARIQQLIFGASDPRTGAITSVDTLLDKPHHNHKVSYQGGVLAEECAQLLQEFFKAKR